MSYHSWTIDGFGFCVDDVLSKTTPYRVLRLLDTNKEFKNEIEDYLKEVNGDNYNINNLELKDIEGYNDNYCRGLGAILFNLINEIIVDCVEDYDGKQYILYEPCYPWTMKPNESMLTMEDVTEIFKKYLKILVDDVDCIDINYQSVENGG